MCCCNSATFAHAHISVQGSGFRVWDFASLRIGLLPPLRSQQLAVNESNPSPKPEPQNPKFHTWRSMSRLISLRSSSVFSWICRKISVRNCHQLGSLRSTASSGGKGWRRIPCTSCVYICVRVCVCLKCVARILPHPHRTSAA
jgi:hypothetical protein